MSPGHILSKPPATQEFLPGVYFLGGSFHGRLQGGVVECHLQMWELEAALGLGVRLWDWVGDSPWETCQEEKQRTDVRIPSAPETHGTELRMQETE